MKLIFWSGWSAVLLAALVTVRMNALANPIWFDSILIPFCGIATALLYRKNSFPKRSLGLAISWIGPLLILLSRMSHLFLLDAITTNAEGAVEGANLYLLVYGVSGLFFLKGCFSGLFMLWLFRWYGLIPFAALAATLWPHRLNLGRFRTESYAATMEKAAEEYPYRWWWFPAICAILPNWTGAIYTAWIMRQFELPV